jgi:AraC-like DNA-binding protein/quercetin dioxygenase-like cupin family protein
MRTDVHESSINKGEELQVYHYGMERCDKGHSFGPAVRDHYLIHFILEGQGTFKVGDKEYALDKNQAFLITPGIVTHYQADVDNPWVYCWIGFNGIKAYSMLKDGYFTQKSPVLHYDSTCLIPKYMEEILNTEVKYPGSSLKRKALLYLIISEIQRINASLHTEEQAANHKRVYVDKAVSFIERNYSRNISVMDIVKYVGLDRSYFSSLFKKSMDISPQGYLVNFRMKKTAGLLMYTDLMIGDIARSVGYNDPLCFSRVFKKVMGSSPLYYRMNDKVKHT